MKKLTSEQYNELLKEEYNELFSESQRKSDRELELKIKELDRKIEYFMYHEAELSAYEMTYEDWSKLSIG